MSLAHQRPHKKIPHCLCLQGQFSTVPPSLQFFSVPFQDNLEQTQAITIHFVQCGSLSPLYSMCTLAIMPTVLQYTLPFILGKALSLCGSNSHVSSLKEPSGPVEREMGRERAIA